MKIKLVKGDITELKVDAIVNAANSSLLGGGGVDGAIHRKGGQELLDDCIRIRNKKGGCPTGQAVITRAGKLHAKFVIHTVGPFWSGGTNNEEQLLSNCYLNSLKIALENEIYTIAFPNISTGIFQFPKEKAATIAIETIQNFAQKETFKEIIFVCFDQENYNIYEKLLQNEV